jgi:spermidine/putrescine transport system substrate-binding protein
MERRKFLAATSTIAGVSLAGCSGGSSGSTDLSVSDIESWPPEEYGSQINVNNWSTEWRDAIIPEFMDEYPGIEDFSVDSYNNPGQFYAQIQSDHSYDNVGSTGVYTKKMMNNDLAVGLPVEQLDTWGEIDDRFIEPTKEHYMEDGLVYGIPATAVVMPVIEYNEDYFDEPPTSFDIFWNEEYKDDMLFWDRDYLMTEMASLYLGYDPQDPDDWDEVQSALEEQRDLNRSYYQSHDTCQQLIASGDAIVAPAPLSTCTQGKVELNDSINYAIPEEGTLYSIDQEVVPAGAPHEVAGAMFSEFSISDTSARINYSAGFSRPTRKNANEIIADYYDDQELAEFAQWDDDWDLIPRGPYTEEELSQIADIYTAVMGA